MIMAAVRTSRNDVPTPSSASSSSSFSSTASLAPADPGGSDLLLPSLSSMLKLNLPLISPELSVLQSLCDKLSHSWSAVDFFVSIHDLQMLLVGLKNWAHMQSDQWGHRLPTVLLCHMFSFLPIGSLLQAGCVNSLWRKVTGLDTVWRQAYCYHWPSHLIHYNQAAHSTGQLSSQPSTSPVPLTASPISLSSSLQSLPISNTLSASPQPSPCTSPTSGVSETLSWSDASSSFPIAFCSPSSTLNKFLAHTPTFTWRERCKAQWIIAHNWETGLCEERALVARHDVGAVHIWCVQVYNDTYLATGDDHGCINIWHLPSSQCIHSWTAHNAAVRCLQFDSNRIITGSVDGNIKIWQLTKVYNSASNGSGTSTSATRTNHNRSKASDTALAGGGTNSFQQNGFSGGDSRIDLFSSHSSLFNNSNNAPNINDDSPFNMEMKSKCLKILRGQGAMVRCLQADDQIVVSGGGFSDSDIRIWDLKSGHVVQLLRGHTHTVLCLQFDAKFLVSSSGDMSVRVWSRTSAGGTSGGGSGSGGGGGGGGASSVVGSAASGNESGAAGIGNNSLTGSIPGSGSGTTYECLHVLKEHTGGIPSFHFDSARNRLITGSWDTTIKIWNLESGVCLSTLKAISPVYIIQFQGEWILSAGRNVIQMWHDSEPYTIGSSATTGCRRGSTGVSTIGNGMPLLNSATPRVTSAGDFHRTNTKHSCTSDNSNSTTIQTSPLHITSYATLYDSPPPTGHLERYESKQVMHTSALFECVQFDWSKVVLGSHDGTVRILDFATNVVEGIRSGVTGVVGTASKSRKTSFSVRES